MVISRKKKVTVLGIDTSTNSLAYCLIDADGNPITWGEVKFSGKNVWERLVDAQSKIPQEIGHLKPDYIYYEGAVYVQNKKTVILLAHALGKIVPLLMVHGAEPVETSPTTWQRYIGNPPLTKVEKLAVQADSPGRKASWYTAAYRDLRKNRTMKWVSDTFGIDEDNDNITDAIAIAHVGYEKLVKE